MDDNQIHKVILPPTYENSNNQPIHNIPLTPEEEHKTKVFLRMDTLKRLITFALFIVSFFVTQSIFADLQVFTYFKSPNWVSWTVTVVICLALVIPSLILTIIDSSKWLLGSIFISAAMLFSHYNSGAVWLSYILFFISMVIFTIIARLPLIAIINPIQKKYKPLKLIEEERYKILKQAGASFHKQEELRKANDSSAPTYTAYTDKDKEQLSKLAKKDMPQNTETTISHITTPVETVNPVTNTETVSIEITEVKPPVATYNVNYKLPLQSQPLSNISLNSLYVNESKDKGTEVVEKNNDKTI